MSYMCPCGRSSSCLCELHTADRMPLEPHTAAELETLARFENTPAAEESWQGYTVELGGQKFTQAQWEALGPYIEGRVHAVSEDAATWSPS